MSMIAEGARLVAMFFAAALAYFAVGLFTLQFVASIDYEPSSTAGEGLMIVVGFFLILPTLVFATDVLDNIEEDYPEAADRLDQWIFRHARQSEDGSDEDSVA